MLSSASKNWSKAGLTESKKSLPAGDPRTREVLRFWFGSGETSGDRRSHWFAKDGAFDVLIRSRFMALHEEAAAGVLAGWKDDARSCLALIVLLDQFPRNMFRASARAFAADPLALETARHAVARGYDAGMRPVERMFVYLPFEHSEALADQQRSCVLMQALDAFAETDDAHRYALRHCEIIERFGRFPHRNAVLGRPSTAQENEFLMQPGSGF
jgi:uncharacterized protein (DUF924 family)